MKSSVGLTMNNPYSSSAFIENLSSLLRLYRRYNLKSMLSISKKLRIMPSSAYYLYGVCSCPDEMDTLPGCDGCAWSMNGNNRKKKPETISFIWLFIVIKIVKM